MPTSRPALPALPASQVMTKEALDKAKADAEASARTQLEAIIADKSQTEPAREKARRALEHQTADMLKMSENIQSELKEKEALEAKIKAMESKVRSHRGVRDGGGGRGQGQGQGE